MSEDPLGPDTLDTSQDITEPEKPLTRKEESKQKRGNTKRLVEQEQKERDNLDAALTTSFANIRQDILDRLQLMTHLGANDKFRSIFQFYGVDNMHALRCIPSGDDTTEIDFIKMLKQLKKSADDVHSYKDYVFINNILASGMFLNFLSYEKQRNGNPRYFSLRLPEAPVMISDEVRSKALGRLMRDRSRSAHPKH